MLHLFSKILNILNKLVKKDKENAPRDSQLLCKLFTDYAPTTEMLLPFLDRNSLRNRARYFILHLHSSASFQRSKIAFTYGQWPLTNKLFSVLDNTGSLVIT